MKNGDNPINPIIQEEHIGQGQRIMQCTQPGLSKREYFAGLALQGLLASNSGQTTKYLVKKAIESTDELLKQLENK